MILNFDVLPSKRGWNEFLSLQHFEIIIIISQVVHPLSWPQQAMRHTALTESVDVDVCRFSMSLGSLWSLALRSVSSRRLQLFAGAWYRLQPSFHWCCWENEEGRGSDSMHSVGWCLHMQAEAFRSGSYMIISHAKNVWYPKYTKFTALVQI